jgi:hypothetical protein
MMCAGVTAASAAVVNWTDATGFWDVATNWSSDPLLPGAADDVTISVSGLQAITHRSGTDTVNSLTSNENLVVNGTGSLAVTGAYNNTANTTIESATLTLNGTSSLDSLTQTGGTLSGTGTVTSGSISVSSGTVAMSSGGLLRNTGTASFGTFTNAAGSQIELANGSATNFTVGSTITNNGAITIAAGGSLTDIHLSSGDVTLAGSGTLTLGGTNARLFANSGAWRLTNNSTIQGFGALGIGQTLLTNNGLIDANSSGNTLLVRVQQGGSANAAIMQASNGGVLRIDNSAINNAGGTIQALSGSTVLLTGNSLITGGTLSTTGTGSIHVSSGQSASLKGVANNGTLTVDNNGELDLQAGTITNNGTIAIAAAGNSTDVRLSTGDVTLAGSGTVTLSGANARLFSNNGAWRLTNDIGHTIAGFGQLGIGQTQLTNNGLIDANSFGNTLLVQSGGFINNSTLQASNGGVLQIAGSTIDNTGGTMQALNNSTVLLGGNSFITGGTLATADSGSIHVVSGQTANLNGVTNNGTFIVDNNSLLNLQSGTITNNGTITVAAGGNPTDIGLSSGDVTLAGSGTVTLGGANARLYANNGAWRLTNNETIQGSGLLGFGQTQLTNNNLIDANSPGNTLLVQVNGSFNAATMQASNGGVLRIDNSVINNAGGTIQALNNSTVLLSGNSFITGGTLATVDSGSIHLVSGHTANLNGVTNNGTFIVENNSDLNLQSSTIANNGTITVAAGGSFTDIRLSSGDVTLAGSGTVTLGGANARLFANNGAWRLTNNQTIQGSGQLGLGQTQFTNNGLIDANSSGNTLVVQSSAFINNSTLRASNGGVLQIASSTIDNTSGAIQALNGSTLQFTGNNFITGGTLATVDSGSIHLVSGQTANLNGVTNNGTFIVDNAGNLNLQSGTITNNGTITVAASGNLTDARLSNGDVTLAGSGTVTLSGANARLLANNGGWRLTNNSTIDGAGQIGLGQMMLSNNGLINANTSGGTITVQLSSGMSNTGTLRAQNGGTLTIAQGFSNSGTVDAVSGTINATGGFTGTAGAAQIGAGGQLNIGAASTVGTLINNGNTAAALNLGANNITVSTAYNNANFGTGNSFNARVNVSGTGLILAAGDVAQAITGANVTNGTSAAPTLTIGNVHVGANTFNYQVANIGSTGPSLQGAIQTTVNGGNINDARLSVAPGNWGPVALGASSGDLALTFTAASAGALSPLSGQVIHIVNNFDNVADQNMNIVLGTGAAAYNLAQGNATPSPVTIGNQRIGGSLAQALTVSNTAPAGIYTEGLNATFGANTGDALNNGGTISLLGGQDSNSSAMVVRVDTSTAGAKSGSVTLNYVSDGTGTSGLGLTSVGSQAINVSGNVYQIAQPTAAAPNPVVLGNQRVGGTLTQALTITNTDISPAGFQEGLNASFTGITGNATATGSITNLAQGGTNSSSLLIGVDTSAAGARSGTATLGLASTGVGTSGLADFALPSQTVNVSGNVYLQAQPSFASTDINLGNVHVGGTANQALSISNTNLAAGFQEGLDASFSGNTAGINTSGGPITNLAAGAPANTNLVVGINTAAAGNVSGTATVALASNGTISGLSNLALPSQTVNVSGNVIAFANPVIADPINFGALAVGSGQVSQTVSITNVLNAPSAAFQELLNASFGTLTNVSGIGTFGTNGGSITGLAPGLNDNTNMVVTFTPGSVAGNINGTVQIQLVSDGTAFGLGTTNLASQTINLTGLVTGVLFNQAQGQATPTDVNFGNVRINTAQNQNLTISNIAPAGPFTEGLNASFGANSGAATNNLGTVANLPGGAPGNPAASNSTNMIVGLDTTVAGARNGTAVVNFQSDGAISGTPTNVGSQTINVSGNVYRLANPTLNTPSVTVAARVGDPVSASGAVSITNTSPDIFTEGLKVSVGAITGNAQSNGGSIANLAAQGTNSSAILVGLASTASAGITNGQVGLNLTSTGVGTTNAPDFALAGQSITVNGKVYTPAVAQVTSAPINFGIVHVGDVVGLQGITVKNDAAVTALNDTLQASLGTVSGPFTSNNGSVSGITAQSSNPSALKVGLNTASAGVFNGAANVNFKSQNPDMADLALASIPVSLQGQVNNYAAPLFSKTGGSGIFSGSGLAFTLNLGTILEGSGSLSANLALANFLIGGPQDALDGTFGFNVDDFTDIGFNPFSGLAAGDSLTGLSVSFDPTGHALGFFSDTITLHPVSENASGQFVRSDVTLTLEGTLTQQQVSVPEPSSLILIAAGMMILLIGRKRLQRRN